MSKLLNIVVLEFDKLQALANYFPILDIISSLTILILFKIIINLVVHKLDIRFNFPFLFLTPSKICVDSTAIHIIYYNIGWVNNDKIKILQ